MKVNGANMDKAKGNTLEHDILLYRAGVDISSGCLPHTIVDCHTKLNGFLHYTPYCTVLLLVLCDC